VKVEVPAMEKDSDSKGVTNEGEKQNFRPRRERKEVANADEKPVIKATQESLQNEDSKPRRRRAADIDDDQEKGTENGGWMSMTSSDNKTQAKKSVDESTDNVPQSSNRDKHFQENDDEIIIIPDLDEDGTDADQRIAHAPRNINRKIPTLVELEHDIKAAANSADSGFELGILLSTLVPSSFLTETDSVWTFENLLRDVTDELTATSKTVTETSVKATAAVITAADKGKVAAKSSAFPMKSQEAHGRIGK
jgi:Intraflagellar transport protein 43